MALTFIEFAKQNQILWFTPKQVAGLMQCSVEHVYDLAKAKKICYIKDGKNIRFKPEDLDEYEKSSYVRRI
ncbi:MAG: helix-turn-helix domain-containing protein [Candidatus Aminicenantes bacterium]|nr:helix-turn-helix domain-containing protein [Candidatus Aminicenantes bacterium]